VLVLLVPVTLFGSPSRCLGLPSITQARRRATAADFRRVAAIAIEKAKSLRQLGRSFSLFLTASSLSISDTFQV